MECPICKKEVRRLRYLHIKGKLEGGCVACMSGKNPSNISTDKRWYHGQGYDFTCSPAHIDHIRHRRIESDGRSVTQCRR